MDRPAEPRLPKLTDYAEEDLKGSSTWMVDKNGYYPQVGDPEPRHTVTVDVQSQTLSIAHDGEKPVTAPLTLSSIHALYHPSEKDFFVEGIRLRITRRDLLTPLGFETLLQVIMMNMVSAVYPRVCRWAPMKKRLQVFSPNTEANHIRNSALYNNFNHLHILANSLTSVPILLALPGPSLDIDYIKKNRSSFVLMAAGRASGKLFDAGIDPDIVYIQDINAQAWGMNFDGLKDRKTSSVLIGNPAGRIWKYAKNFQRVFKAWNLYPFETDIFPRLEEIAPSTTSGAYSVARLLGGSPIVMMGNDSGTNISPLKTGNIPEMVTNLTFQEDEEHLIFSPTTFQDLYLRFGDEFSVMTQNDYIAGVQWLKSKISQEMKTSRLDIYDLSTTGLCRFNSQIMDGVSYKPKGEVTLPQFPHYSINYDIEKFLRQKKSAYSFIMRQLDKGVIPKTAWRHPLSCVLSNTDIHHSDGISTRVIDVQIAKDNTEFILQHLDIALEELAEQRAAEK